jgi:hypothetical protein
MKVSNKDSPTSTDRVIGLAVAQVNDWIDRFVAGINPLYEPKRVAVLDDRDPEYPRIPQGRRRGDPRLVHTEV